MNGIFSGFDERGRAIIYTKTPCSGGEGHVFLSAAPRPGEALDILIPVLLQYDQGSCIVIDPKGQLAAIAGPQRAHGTARRNPQPLRHPEHAEVRELNRAGVFSAVDPTSSTASL